MADWFRSITLLAISFVGVVVVTLGLAALIVPGPAASSQDGAGGSPVPSGAAVAPSPSDAPRGLGGSLAVSGDREATFDLRSESLEGNYALVGNDGRVVFEGEPAEVTQVSFDGLEFFPEPEDCTVTPLDVDTAVGIGFAELTCTDLPDIRENGVISLAGTVGLSLDRLVGRALPPQGGSVAVGDETWTFEYAFLITWQSPAVSGEGRGNYNMELVDEPQATALYFTYDPANHGIGLIDLERDGEVVAVPDGACTLERTELGKQNPRDVTIELAIECAAVEVPGLGSVPISGSVVVDELGFPF
ncbi:MAG TPA: hypothetical protein VIZ22_05610 [Candidatus Limnocylindrales bacterium]